MEAITISNQYLKQETNPIVVLEAAIEGILENEDAFISVDLERAYVEAEASKNRWEKGIPLSLFDGVLISWKDLYDLKNSVTTAGSITKTDGIVSQKDANLVSALSRMGLVNLGKTNMTEFAYSGLGLNPHFGTPKNAINPAYIPGGSSSGAAVAVAKGITQISMGTDTAGSIRIPSSFNNIVGYKSTSRRYSMEGVFPLARSVDSLGPLANSVTDCYVIDQLIHGNPFPRLLNESPSEQYRFVVDPEILDNEKISDDVKAHFEKTIANLISQGVSIEQRSIKSFKTALAIIDSGRWIGAAEAYTLHKDLLQNDDSTKIDPLVFKRLLAAKEILASTQIELYQAREILKSDVAKELRGCSLLSPTVGCRIPTFSEVSGSEADFFDWNAKVLRLTMAGSFLDMPGISIPSGNMPSGLPAGLLVSTYSGNDDHLFRAAIVIEDINCRN